MIKPTKLIGIITLIILSANVRAQTFEWLRANSIDYTLNPDYLYSTVAADQDNNVYFFGPETFSMVYGIAAFGNLFIQKYSNNGDLLYVKTISGDGSVTGIVTDPDGYVYLYGKYISTLDFWGDLSLTNEGLNLYHFLVKIDENGNVLWGKNLNETEEFLSNFEAVATDNQGNVFIGYDTWWNSYISALDDDGNIINTITQENVKSISSISVDNQGNIVASGTCANIQCNFNGVGYDCPYTYNYYLVKYDSAGNPMWVKFVEDITCQFSKVVTDGDNSIYWSGPLYVDTRFDDIHAMGPDWVYDFYLVKLNADGEYQWLREVPEVTTGDASTGSLHHLDVQSDGNIVITGFTRGTIDWGNQVVSEGNGFDHDILVLNFSPDGTTNWAKTAGGQSRDRAHSIFCDNNDNLFIAGFAENAVSFDTINYQTDDFIYSFVAKLNTELTTLNEAQYVSRLTVYPNPVGDYINFQQTNYDEVAIFNSMGQTVMQSKEKGNSSLDVHGLQKGLYFLSLKNPDGSRVIAKFLKQ